ncbi:bacteriocin immunity protein [Pseudomonas plecoglossicida]|uniref:Bacteriocin immunity protein n=1 Tax=Pseudomonas plecoglossicida TaxID=70775 RepID=A0AAD0R031_PSEDL|nr:bacteriocin immunity protein [Pseudomonas plecoglossicida]AXM98137.1 bacteriocin immunity protein [Pseudomonas plecoglossicida]QLB57950.1 bacteriocin immunity protein [Pseudomonas plecoglossicida]GLR37588.1 pyocin-S2 immunity protein [Pseudomonas plecoglossicida]
MVKISDYTERAFFEFVAGIYNADPRIYPNERSHTKAILEFEKMVEHPLGASLIFHPTRHGMKDDPGEIVQVVKAWRAEQGLPGFKAE